MRETVDSMKALLVTTLSLKMNPKEYHHSGNFTFCFVALVNFRYQTQYVNKREPLASFAPSAETPKRSLRVLVFSLSSIVFDFRIY